MSLARQPLTPHSRLLARGCVDGRSREGRFLAAARAELAAHVGGNPSSAQKVLIDRTAWLRLHVMLLDEKVAGGKPLTAHDQRSYLAFSNSLVRAMRETRPACRRPRALVGRAHREALRRQRRGRRMKRQRRAIVRAGGTPSILDALADPDLFKSLFPVKSWRAWRAFLAALFALPLTDDALALYRHHTGRAALPTRPFRESAIVCGRRGGKSRVLGLIAAYLGAFVDYRPYLAPGEQPVIAIIAADRKQARVLLRYVIGTLRAVPLLASLIDGEPLAESVTLTNGVVIEIHTGTIASPRGRTYVAVLADEIAFWQSADGAANPDTEVISAVRPGLASIPNSILLMASSPYAKRGVLWQAFRQHFGKDGARVLVWRGTTAEMNPTLDPEIIREAYEADPESAASEYGAEFRNDIAAFIPREVVDALIIPGRFELPWISGTNYFAFVDPSGGSSDAFTLAIGHRDKDGLAVLDCVRERRPPFSPEGVVEEFAAVLKSYGVHRVTGDHYAGEWPREQFRKHSITYDPSERNKSAIYLEALPLLNSGKVELLDNTRLISQICGLERRTARGGKDSIDHAPGAHDDLCNSALGALVLASATRAKLVITDQMLEMSRLAGSRSVSGLPYTPRSSGFGRPRVMSWHNNPSDWK